MLNKLNSHQLYLLFGNANKSNTIDLSCNVKLLIFSKPHSVEDFSTKQVSGRNSEGNKVSIKAMALILILFEEFFFET